MLKFDETGRITMRRRLGLWWCAAKIHGQRKIRVCLTLEAAERCAEGVIEHTSTTLWSIRARKTSKDWRVVDADA